MVGGEVPCDCEGGEGAPGTGPQCLARDGEGVGGLVADVVEHPEEAAVRGLLAIAERGRGGLTPPLLVVGVADPHGVPVRVDGDVLSEDVRGRAPARGGRCRGDPPEAVDVDHPQGPELHVRMLIGHLVVLPLDEQPHGLVRIEDGVERATAPHKAEALEDGRPDDRPGRVDPQGREPARAGGGDLLSEEVDGGRWGVAVACREDGTEVAVVVGDQC